MCSKSKVKMITIPRSCFTIIYLFKSPFFSLLPLPYLLHFLISNFPLISQLLIYSTFIIIQNNPILSLIPSKLINKLKKKKNLPTNPRSNLFLPLFSLTIFLIFITINFLINNLDLGDDQRSLNLKDSDIDGEFQFSTGLNSVIEVVRMLPILTKLTI